MSATLELLAAVASGDRRALSKAITLLESSRPADGELVNELRERLGAGGTSGFRVGVTGVPGAGKSTLIDALGMQALAAGRRVAVLAVDPSSRLSGGSVLGDKTRMNRLASAPLAFVRPSPSLGILGGIAGRTREAILLCELAGYDLIFVETVGVGQSEEQVATMVDAVLLVLLAGAGDEISSMKRGVLEAADLIAFNKADGERARSVDNDASALRASLSISRPEQPAPVLTVSALEGSGVGELWSALLELQNRGQSEGSLGKRRLAQLRAWFDAALEEELRELFSKRPALGASRKAAEESVLNGALAPAEAARRLVSKLLGEPER